MGAGLDVGAYVVGSAYTLTAPLALAWGAWSVRSALLPRWSGCNARLAEITIALSIGFGVAQLVGAVGLLRLGPLWVAEVLAGTVAGLLGRRAGRPHQPRAAPAAPLQKWQLALVAVLVAVVAVQWAGHVSYAVTHGMTHTDTLWYHMPFSARFAQDGSFARLDGVGYPAAHWFPLNSQLLHTMAFLPFRRDVLSPFLNLGWAVLAVLAAWSIGQRRNAGAISVAAAVVVLGLPTLAGTQPGQALTDIACAALFLTAIALLFASDLEPVPLALAGAATGLAISTKITVAVPVLALTLLVIGHCLSKRKLRAAAAWLGAIAITGSFWFIRNWVLADNPLPWFKLALGPLSLPVSVEDQGPTLVDDGLLNGKAWRDLYLPGLQRGFGEAWFVIVMLAIGGAALLVLHRGRPLERIAGMAALVGMVGYLFTPQSAGFAFVFNLRYLSPVLLLGLVAVPLSLPNTPRWRTAQLVVAAVLVAVGAAASHHERVPAWSRESFLPAIVAVVALGAVLLVLAMPGKVRLPGRGLVAAAVILVIVLVGWPLQRTYLEHRYAGGGLPLDDDVAEYFRDVRDSRVALFGGIESYPLFGLDESNRVRLGSDPPPRPGPDACRWWRSALDDRYDYIVLTDLGFGLFIRPPEDVIARDSAAELVLRHDDSAIYRVRGPMHPATCPTPAG